LVTNTDTAIQLNRTLPIAVIEAGHTEVHVRFASAAAAAAN
jgi:hypothetical protein